VAFIYNISGNLKSFTFKRRIYTVPCKVTVGSLDENKLLKGILRSAGITEFKVKRSKKVRKADKMISLGNGDGTISLNARIKN
jgi:hypothetical protein